MKSAAQFLWHKIPSPIRIFLVTINDRARLKVHYALDAIIDAIYGISTSKIVKYTKCKSFPGEAFSDQFFCIPTPYYTLWRIIEKFGIKKSDVVYDLGCGLGRPLFVFSIMGAKKVVGIEINKILHQGLKQNIETFRGKDVDASAVNDDVLNCNMDDASVIYMFNPFGKETMAALAKNLTKSLKKNPRKLSIIYWCPHWLDELKSIPGFKIEKSFVQRRNTVIFATVGPATARKK